MSKCKWVVRPGVGDTLWAYTPCKKGYNYLSKVKCAEHVESVYNGRICPICGNTIECDMSLLEEKSLTV